MLLCISYGALPLSFFFFFPLLLSRGETEERDEVRVVSPPMRRTANIFFFSFLFRAELTRLNSPDHQTRHSEFSACALDVFTQVWKCAVEGKGVWFKCEKS